MKPITRKEYYLAKAAGAYTGPTPQPVLREDYYLATLAGDYSGHCPSPVTRLDMFMSAAAGIASYVPQPVTRIEKYWYAIAKGTGYVPEPVTREEKFLYAILKNPPKPEYVDKTAEGSTILLTDSTQAPLTALTVYGKSTQDGTPSPENPVPIVSAGDEGEINVEVLGGNLISSDISNWHFNGWESFEQVVKLPNGIKLKATNGWCKLYYDTSEMNGRTLNFSFDYQQIESETTSPNTNEAFAVVLQDENVYPTDNNDDFIFDIFSPQTVKTHVSVSFTARNYLCFFLRVNTEGITEEPETRTIEITNIMLNAGDTELTYEPYKTPQTFSLSTPNGLPGIPVTSGGNYTDENGQQWVCDEVDLARGKYVQRVKKINVKSVTQYVPSENFGGIKVRDILSTQTRVPVMSNRFVFKKSLKDDGTCFGYENFIRLYYNLGSLENFNKWLTENDVVGWYPLDIPIETDLPAEEIAAYKALHTYSPTTTVSNDAGAWMKVGYKAAL